VLGRRRVDLVLLGVWHHDASVAGRVRLHVRVVERHRDGLQDLPQIAGSHAFTVQPHDHVGNVLRLKLIDAAVTDDREGAVDRRPVLRHRPRRHADA
jgi:hypothetical protein